ncbi:MAG: hypothetical protein ACJ8FT_04740 [Sphingomonas sp.]
MTARMLMVAAAATALAPSLAAAAPGGNGSTSPGSTTGAGYDHLNGPDTSHQPNQSCEETPTTPGNAADALGSAFNPDGTAGGVYAGEQTQNQRNSQSVSQYDVACTKQR